MFHKEGAKIIFVALAVTVGVVLLAEEFIHSFWLLKTIQIVALAFLILILQFFRNPLRRVSVTDHNIIAPVDGSGSAPACINFVPSPL